VTSSSGAVRGISAAALLVASAATAVWLQMVREQRFPQIAAGTQLLYVQSPSAVKRLALSFDAVLADIYWIRLVQYYGGTRLSKAPDKNYDLLYPFLDLTTSLDPQFSVVYRFGAFFLAEPPPGGPGRPDLAERLIRKGMAANPQAWEYPHDMAFLYYRNRDFAKAADWFRRAAAVPGAPDWIAPLSAVTLAAGGQTDASRAVWRNLLASDEAWLRDAARFRLQQLDTIDFIGGVQKVVDAHTAAQGRPPAGWEMLIRGGILRGVPTDAAGRPLRLDPNSGHVTIDPASPLAPLPTDKAP
jgi:hypothetical protein